MLRGEQDQGLMGRVAVGDERGHGKAGAERRCRACVCYLQSFSHQMTPRAPTINAGPSRRGAAHRVQQGCDVT